MQARICLDCSRLYPDEGGGDHGRCPSCRPAHLKRRNRTRTPHRMTARRATGQAFYASTAWRKVRDMVRKRDGVCQRCGTTANLTAHHLESIHTRPDLALDPANVITLCRSCHGHAENAQRKGRSQPPPPPPSSPDGVVAF